MFTVRRWIASIVRLGILISLGGSPALQAESVEIVNDLIRPCEQEDSGIASSPGHAGARSKGVIQATRVQDEAVVIDAVLSESCWKATTPTTDFLQKEPVEGGIPQSKTEVWICYDASALYIAARMFHPPSGSILTTMSRRDNAGNSERILFSMDTYFDHRTAYTFGVTASGVRIDYYHPEDQEYSRDYSFDPVWETRVSSDSVSWSAEIRIPFSQLRFSPGDSQTWGLNMNRWVPTTNEDIYWQLIGKQETGWASRFGKIIGIEGIHPTRPIELVPFFTANSTMPNRRDIRYPYGNGVNLAANAGLDLKFGIGSNLTVDGTINPDFGQVEADPAEVNLSAYETYFSERRPFFFEGNSILEGNGARYFYSRRIGARPHGFSQEPGAAVPGATTILGATKLTGRFPSGLSVGALTALTSREYSDPDRTLVEPLTGYGVMRVQKEFGPYASTAGVMLTGVTRDFSHESGLEDILDKRAITGGGDCVVRFDNRDYTLNAYLGFSHLTGSPASLLRIQQAPAHYFQRPDAGHVRIDSSRSSLAGYTGSIQVQKVGGEHWLWSVGLTTESPGFDLNDAGYLQSADDIDSYALLQYRETKPGSILHQYSLYLGSGISWNYDKVHKGIDMSFRSELTWRNFWRSTLEIDHAMPGLSDDLTRGGPLMGTAANTWIWLSTSSNFADSFRWTVRTAATKDASGGWGYEGSLSLGYRPAGSLELSIEPRYERHKDVRQFISTLPGGGPATFGKRYVFGTIDRSTLSLQLRCNYAFTPDLSLEVYAEPFAANGHFFDFGELAAARSRDLRIYGTNGSSIISESDGKYRVDDNGTSFAFSASDFLVHSLRSNLVLRWEWIRGSALYLVWQQDRASFLPSRNLVSPRDVLDAFSAPGTHFVALKVSYWLPV